MESTSGAVIPGHHAGPPYQDFMEALTSARRPPLYLEVGVQAGELMERIHAEIAIGVDTEFVINANVAQHKRQVRLFQQSSDAFFAGHTQQSLGRAIDVAFLDGMHSFEFLLRDFYNSERLCGPDSVIAMHDCLPLNAEMADRDMAEGIARGLDTRHPFLWTGDVWKIIPILQRYRPDLRVLCLDCPPTGLVLVTNPDPTSTVLESRYLEAARDFRDLPNDVEAIAAMYRSITILPAADVLREMGAFSSAVASGSPMGSANPARNSPT